MFQIANERLQKNLRRNQESYFSNRSAKLAQLHKNAKSGL